MPRPADTPDSVPPKTVLVTGGCGFIGSALVRLLIHHTPHRVVNLDALTYAGSPSNVEDVASDRRYAFVEGDVTDERMLDATFGTYGPDAVVHLAAETHVDRSIDGPAAFVRTNVLGTFELLEAARRHLRTRTPFERQAFRFVHVSTDEVFGSLGATGRFGRDTPYDPRSPYSASKAGSDHLARAAHHTFGLPVIVTNCSNNYGPYQFPEKLVPHTVLRALHGLELPVYGDGRNVRDWLHVDDHARGLTLALERGSPGSTYLFGADQERTTLDVVEAICGVLDEVRPAAAPHARLIAFVEDRPGHDFRYAIDADGARRELGWNRRTTFDEGIRETVAWYLEHLEWCERRAGARHGLERLGTLGT
ncbi:MAG: dTDP-glucose 4,6-dehydratase [Trueperaceae bacterium]|nr:dTDP-glucose 4,6-dehydratase [Trueperaceae bacterium]